MNIKSVLVRHSPEDPPIITDLVNLLVKNDKFTVKFVLVKSNQTCIECNFIPSGNSLIGDITFARFLTRQCSTTLNGVDPFGSSEIDQWISFSEKIIQSNAVPKEVSTLLSQVNNHLALRTFLVEPSLSLADICIWVALRKCMVQSKAIPKVLAQFQFVNRWFLFLEKHTEFQTIIEKYFKAKNTVAKPKKEKMKGINLGHTGG